LRYIVYSHPKLIYNGLGSGERKRRLKPQPVVLYGNPAIRQKYNFRKASKLTPPASCADGFKKPPTIHVCEKTV
jgi:hypothetical protein